MALLQRPILMDQWVVRSWLLRRSAALGQLELIPYVGGSRMIAHTRGYIQGYCMHIYVDIWWYSINCIQIHRILFILLPQWHVTWPWFESSFLWFLWIACCTPGRSEAQRLHCWPKAKVKLPWDVNQYGKHTGQSEWRRWGFTGWFWWRCYCHCDPHPYHKIATADKHGRWLSCNVAVGLFLRPCCP